MRVWFFVVASLWSALAVAEFEFTRVPSEELTQAAEADSPALDLEKLRLASLAAAAAPLAEGELLVDKRADWVVPIASITKVMTALVVMDSGQPLDEWLEILPRAYPAPANAYSRIRIGSQATRRDLLTIALMSSENLAAYQLARHYPQGYAAFIQAMNDKARELGMHNTHFVDSTGLSAQNTSTAADLIKLVRAAHSHPELTDFSTRTYHRVNFRSPRYGLDYGNTNVLVHRARWDVQLSKTGYLSAAGRCLVMVAQGDGEPLVYVMLDSLGSRSPLGDAGRIRRWLETGDSGPVAQSARQYERERSASYQPPNQPQVIRARRSVE
ncbi:D-alanyl-D-alanine endopeptidase [Marinimicrobium alkaliphilum]|uniref:D-alanyl-D-alanine endopeptidase n=1 Tax=Marinimicrobium alkaliphilum TaxID=2202654 RepID=UPI000DB9F791|nr:D-alanyl-D-alanine endopeptidase [Marinimicrobium alkaliphilum]